MVDDTTKAWWLDESSHAGAEHLDPDYVEGYEAKAGFDPAEDIALLETLGLGAAPLVVDIGAGTGVFAFAAARSGARVVAVDVSPAMIDTMKTRIEAGGLSGVIPVEAGFLSYRHQGAPADMVYTRNALHQLPDFWKVIALDRMASILKPGGLLRLRDLVFDLEPSGVGAGLDEWIDGAVDDPSRGFTGSELAAHVRLEHSTYSWLLESMLDRTGFEILDRHYRRSAYGTYTCRRR
jgi:ubiquinone/menaquinone biosynthesis C-methylase UbiE